MSCVTDKAEFFALVANMSHELRTPLTVIRGYADILENFGEDLELVAEATDAIKKSAQNMQDLVESVLFLARADQNNLPLNKTPIEVNELLKSVVEKYNNPRLEFLQGETLEIEGDKFFLEKMFREIIDNALNFSAEKIFIKVESNCVKITDSGIGIAPENVEKIFDRFFKIDKSRTSQIDEKNSAGLGLSIAKWIAENHGIKIEVESQLGHGTKFILNIPLVDEK